MEQNEQYGSWHADNELQPHEGKSNIMNVSQNERIFSSALGGWFLSSGLHSLLRHPIDGFIKTTIGGILLYRGLSGNCPLYSAMGKSKNASHTPAINIRTSMVVNKPKDEVYAFWRKLENLPLFMKHLASVTEIDQKHSHWEAVMPGNIGKIKWNAEIVKEEPGYLIGWQSIANSMINNAGKVTFNDASDGRGTEIEAVISYHPPAGDIGAGLAKVLNPVFEKIIKQDIMNFKEYIETKNSPSGTTGGSVPSMSAGSGAVNTGASNYNASSGAVGSNPGNIGGSSGNTANRTSNQ